MHKVTRLTLLDVSVQHGLASVKQPNVLQSTCNKERCVLAACRCIARAAQKYRLCVSDCHYFNFGVRITADAGEHEVVIIDVGSRGIAESVVGKGKVNECMWKLWKWTRQELLTSPDKTQELWYSEQTLEDVIKRLDTAWQDQPYLTIHPRGKRP